LDQHSLSVLEYPRVTAAIAALAESDGARTALAAWRPFADRAARAREHALLGEALRRNAEPGEWCRVGRAPLAAALDPAQREPLDAFGLLEVLAWLEAGRDADALWPREARERFPRLGEALDALPDLEPLRARLARALEPDGRVSDAASPALARARGELARGERALEQRLTAWARAFGEGAFVTRHADRFVALVPAAGFPRRRAIVHDVSGSGQSLFVEPLEMCDANNDLLELQGTVRDEERRVLLELADAVRAERDAVLALEAALVHLDTLRARARWARDVRAVVLEPGGERLDLRAARHPLLAMGERRDALIPLDLALEGARLLLVSGPNMGGKTVLLKTVGLAVALAHSALPVPAAEGSTVPEIDDVLVDLGDEQSVDRGLSTFAAHLQTLAAMAEAASPTTLLLCDELGAGTDPEEGAALGRALVEHFATRRAWGVVTTHLGSLKRVAGEVPGVLNGSLEFDLATMTPRYRFIAGVPGASHALAVAARLGFPRDVLARAEAMAPGEARALERLIAELLDVRRATEAEGAALRVAREAAEAEAARLREATEDSKRTLSGLRARLTREAEVLLSHARELWQTVQKEARKAEKSRAGAESLRGELSRVEQGLDALARDAASAAGEESAPSLAAVDVGRRVRVTDLGVDADVVTAPDAEGKVVLQRGSWTIHSHVSRLAPTGATATAPARAPLARWESDAAPALEVNLRGMDVEEALRTLDAALDRAVLSGLSELRVVHGIGRGVLRTAVERHLNGHPQVATRRLGEGHEGGRGATVVTLR
jgi:DNA mismatch repair protein MutS2